MAFGILGFTGGCGGTVRSHNLFGKQGQDVGMLPRLGAIAADAVAVLAMGIILGVAAGGALHLSPAAAYGMTGAIAAIPLLDIGGTIFHSVVGKRHFNCLADKLTCLREDEQEDREVSRPHKQMASQQDDTGSTVKQIYDTGPFLNIPSDDESSS